MIDHPTWAALQQHIARNLPEYMTFLAALSIAWVCSIPEKIPSNMQEWWTWARNTLQTAVPAARASNNHTQPNPTIPPSGDQPTKQETK